MTKILVNIAYQNMTEQGFEFLNCQGLHPEFYFCGDSVDRIERSHLQNILNTVEQHSFESTLHAPFFDLNIGARDSRIRHVSFERLIWALEAAAILKSTIVVIHPGYGPWVLSHNFEPWLKRATPMLHKLCEHAASLNLKIAFENIYDSKPDDLLQLIQTVNVPHAGICFDVGHFNVFSKLPMSEWLDKIGNHIFECHLHDNDRSADQHLSVGDGNIDYGPLRDWLQNMPVSERPVLTLELPQRTHVIKSVNSLKSWQL